MNKIIKQFGDTIVSECLAGTWDWNLSENKEILSDGFKQVLGYSPEEISDDLSYRQKLVHPDDIQKIEESFRIHEASRGEITFKNEVRYIHKSGAVKWFLSTGKIVEWSRSTGKPVRMVGCYIDIQAQKKSEEKLRESEYRTRLLLRNMTEGFAFGKVIYDADGQPVDHMYLSVNKAFTIIYGLEENQIVGRSMSTVLKNHKGRFKSWLELFSQVASGDEKQNHQRIVDYSPLVDKWVEVSVFCPAKGEFGVTFHDITKRKKAQFALDKSMKLMEDQNDRLFNFAHIVSHNLRTHGNNLKMLLEIHEMEDLDKVQRDGALNQIKGLSESFSKTVKELEKIAEIQTKQDLELKSINLKEAIEEAKQTVVAEIKKHNVLFENLVEEDVQVVANPAYLQSIVLNLVSNALKYRHPDRNATIELNTKTIGEYVVLAVKDNGIGMDSSKVEKKIFGLHNTFHDNEDARGVGLFITKTQIQSMEGDIYFESKLGEGTTFFVELRKSQVELKLG